MEITTTAGRGVWSHGYIPPRGRPDLGVDDRSARARRFQVLQDEKGRPFAEHHAVVVRLVGPAAFRAAAGRGRQHAHLAQSPVDVREHLVDAARHHGERAAVSHEGSRARHRQISRHSGLVDGDGRAAGADLDGRHRGHAVHHGIGEDHRREPRGAALEIAGHELLARPEVAMLRAHDEAERRPPRHAGVLDGETRRDHGQTADPREPARRAGIEETFERGIVDLGPEPARPARSLESADRTDGARRARENLGHHRGAADSARADRAHPGDDHAAGGAHRPKTRLTFWPPKPKELDRTASSSTARAVSGTQSNGTSGSVTRRLAVGGTSPC